MFRLSVVSLFLILSFVPLITVTAISPTIDPFEVAWERTDLPVETGQVSRSWIWGPSILTGPFEEIHDDSPGGVRTVQYFDKSRMELVAPGAGQSGPEFVTNGLLATEMITGMVQLGDATFEQRDPAVINVAGDTHDPFGPTYQSFSLRANDPPLAVGTVVMQRIDRDGVTIEDEALTAQNIAVTTIDDVTNHAIAQPFWEFMNAIGLIWDGESYVEGTLFEQPHFATGRPITEPYWADVLVGGVSKLVLIQCFERRCLTYTPTNEPAWQVEAGNVGQAYFNWRYGQIPAEQPQDPQPPDTNTDIVPSFPSVAPTSFWHPPGNSGYQDLQIHGHEHGCAPPAWADEFSLASFGYPVGYGGDERTPNEDQYKHPGFKGYCTSFGGGEQYWRMHMMTTPVGESSIFHSMEAYMRDPQGNVSFVQGWIDFANGGTAGGEGITYLERPGDGECDDPSLRPLNPEGRPRMAVNTLYCYETDGIFTFTSWYSDFHKLLPETGVNQHDTFFHDGDPDDPATWTVNPFGLLGLDRRIEATWEPERAPVFDQWFWADQWGNTVTGVDDPRCGVVEVHHQQPHIVKCLPQFVASSAIALGFPDNAQEFLFPGDGVVQLPN